VIVVTDLEGTLTTGQTWRGVTRYLNEQGRGWAVRTFLLPYVAIQWLGKLRLRDTQADRMRFMVDLARLTRGLPEAEWDVLAERVVEQTLWPGRYLRVMGELESLRKGGARVIVCSGAYQPIVAAFARRAGFEALGTPLVWKDGRSTGALAAPINNADLKAAALRGLLGSLPIDQAYGDTAGDIAMLSLAREATVIDHDPVLRAAAVERGWRILTETEARAAV